MSKADETVLPAEVVSVEKRFTSYIASLIHFNSINFDKRMRGLNSRYLLTLDSPSASDGSETSALIDSVESSVPIYQIEESLEDQISDPKLYKALKKLNARERAIINLSFYYEFNDTQIGKILRVSQQSISKSKKKILLKLRNAIEGMEQG